MKGDPAFRIARALLLAWSIGWFLVWVMLMARGLRPARGGNPPSLIWWMSGALLAAWAGLFLYRGLDRRD